MKYILLFFAAVVAMTSCIKNELTPPPPESDVEYTSVKFNISCADIAESRTISRVNVDENAVMDLNIYFFHSTLDTHKHIYFGSLPAGGFSMELAKGEYEVYAVANAGEDLGYKASEASVERLRYRIESQQALQQGECLPMSARTKLLAESGEVCNLLLSRRVAKVNFNLSIADDFAQDFMLNDISIHNCPKEASFFHKWTYDTYSEQSELSMSSTFYVLQNNKGVIPSITNQTDKNSANAPQGATYILVRGTHKSKMLEYRIYLGANNTSDFNLEANKRYIVNTTISGANKLDNRVSIAEMSLSAYSAQYDSGETLSTTLSISQTNGKKNYFLKYRILQGGGTLLFDGEEQRPNWEFWLMNASQTEASMPITFVQKFPSPVKIELTVVDSDGMEVVSYIESEFVGLYEIVVEFFIESICPRDSEILVRYEASDKLPMGTNFLGGLVCPVRKTGDPTTHYRTIGINGINGTAYGSRIKASTFGFDEIYIGWWESVRMEGEADEGTIITLKYNQLQP